MASLLSLLTLLLTAGSCDASGPAPTSGTLKDATQHCDPNISLACKQVQWRYKQFANADQYGYFYGFVQGVAEPVVVYVVQGAIFPVNDTVTPPDYQEGCSGSGSGACAVVRQNQQPDGTWGTNGDAVFGKLADGQYFEWMGPFAFSFQALSFRATHTQGCPKSGGPSICNK